jgi:hypothetical protein
MKFGVRFRDGEMATLFIVLMVTSSCANGSRGDSLSGAYAQLVQALGDPALSMWKRETAKSMLSEGDKEVIPVLISALGDRRTFDPEYVDPSASIDAKPRIQTVGEVCERVLYGVISGHQLRRYYVADWPAWWDQHKSKDLSEIIAMVRANSVPSK